MVEVIKNGKERSNILYILDIQITGVNDYAPLFLFSPYTVYINEDKKPGSVISNPLPYDFDKGVDGTTVSAILGNVPLNFALFIVSKFCCYYLSVP